MNKYSRKRWYDNWQDLPCKHAERPEDNRLGEPKEHHCSPSGVTYHVPANFDPVDPTSSFGYAGAVRRTRIVEHDASIVEVTESFKKHRCPVCGEEFRTPVTNIHRDTTPRREFDMRDYYADELLVE